MHQTRGIVATLKGALFLGGICLWGSYAPLAFYILPSENFLLPAFYLPHLGFLLIVTVWIVFILKSAFFARARQFLKPLWLPAALCWLIPVVALMVASSIEGIHKLGFPLPLDAGGYEEPWTACLRGLWPQMAIMLCVLAVACMANKFVKSLSAKSIKCAVLAAFGLLCLHASYWARNRFEYSWSTWTEEEMFHDVFIWGGPYLAFWLCIGLVPAWRIAGELLALTVKDWRAYDASGSKLV